MNDLNFLSGLLALLAAPGPTNALMIASGALGGLRQGVRAAMAATAGYATSIALIGFLLGPVIAREPAVSVAVRLGAAMFLMLSAIRIWRSGHAGLAQQQAGGITPKTLFLTSLLNPKGFILCFAILPEGWMLAPASALPQLLSVACAIPLISFGWAVVGWALSRGTSSAKLDALVSRLSAVALGLFAAGLGISTLGPLRAG